LPSREKKEYRKKERRMNRGSRRESRVKLLTERSGKRRIKLVAVYSGWK
jgi:hypothetical protein